MATIRQIKDKQISIKSINKITKAMQLTASAKSSRAIKAWFEYKLYFKKVNDIVYEISKTIPQEETKGTYWIFVMSDIGLAGGYNSNIIKMIPNLIKPGDKYVVVGNKGKSLLKKYKDGFLYTLSEITHQNSNEVDEIKTQIKKAYYDYKNSVKIVYTSFINQMTFEPIVKTIFPIEKPENYDEEHKNLEPTLHSVIEFEVPEAELMKQISSLYIHSFIIGIYRESQASELTSRRIAMEAASKNGEELLEKLNIDFNRIRQAKITQEISEIISGAESLK